MARRVAILAVGDELLAGEGSDSNSPWLARKLRADGHLPVLLATAGDDVPSIAAAVTRAAEAAEVLLVTGGLGPTRDDLTRDGVAAACGVALVERPELLATLSELYARAGRPPPGSDSRRQAWLPEGAQALLNPHGTAPGFTVRGLVAGRPLLVACLPGVPTEMKAMAAAFCAEHLPAEAAHGSVRLLACGPAEAELGRRLADLMDHAQGPRDDLRVGITVSRGILSVVLRGTDAAALAAAAEDVRARLGDDGFGEGEGTRLVAVVVAALAARGLCVTTAESCTGGLLAAELTSVPGSSTVFREGWVTYSNTAKTERLGVPADLLAAHGAVSLPVVAAMASGARERSGADFALAISGVAGPDGGTEQHPVGLICFALAERDGCRSWERRWTGTREELRGRAVNVALDALRRRLLLPVG